MTEISIPVVVISGPVGVGKSTVGEEVSNGLNRRQVPHTFVDFDQLRYTYPRPSDDPWGDRLGLKNLADLWRNSFAAGARNLVIAYVVEHQAFIEDLQAVIPNSAMVTVQLGATVETLQQRVRYRETGSGLDWHLRRAVELARRLESLETPCDQRIRTDGRSVAEIATAILEQVVWREV
jgi:hypothetical protein